MLIGKENVDESWNLLLTLLIFEMPRKLKYEMKLIMKEKLWMNTSIAEIDRSRSPLLSAVECSSESIRSRRVEKIIAADGWFLRRAVFLVWKHSPSGGPRRRTETKDRSKRKREQCWTSRMLPCYPSRSPSDSTWKLIGGIDGDARKLSLWNLSRSERELEQ